MKIRTLALLGVLVFAAQAQAIVVVGTTAGGATWTRPVAGSPPTPPVSGVGIGVNYTVLPFTVSAAGSYIFLSSATSPLNWDNFTLLYQTAFNPASQFTNVLIGNDDQPSIGQSGFTYALNTSTTYLFITTGFAPGDAGAYSNSITGPGSVNVVPEPASFGLMALGLALVCGAARRRAAQR